ncbi:hypothetical protein GGR13_000775 [Brevundimonas variabilis]|uniref:Uncharacterized protein n=1 Tax=Brevundimonas variabilis TaxID=74312 RepID=A0A7W9CGX3_9CAUL|nr:hypothetical protein [Brevundimonas variabilis]
MSNWVRERSGSAYRYLRGGFSIPLGQIKGQRTQHDLDVIEVFACRPDVHVISVRGTKHGTDAGAFADYALRG